MHSESDKRLLQAAVGWLELGNLKEASQELEQVSPEMYSHPDVLQVRVKIFLAAEKWERAGIVAEMLCRLLPYKAWGPLHLAVALRKLDRVKDARAALLPVANKFPDEWRIAYQLSTYECQLGHKRP